MVSSLQSTSSLTTLDALFKTKFDKASDNTYNDATLLLGRCNRNTKLNGKKIEFPAPFGYSGSVAFGSLPEVNEADYRTVTLTRKKIYGGCKVDRESVKASQGDEGAWVDLWKEPVKKTVESVTRVLGMMEFEDGSGALGTVTGTPGAAAPVYTIVISTATWNEARWEERDFVNVGAGTDLFEVTTVTPSTRTIVLTRQSGGSDAPADTNIIYLQKSKDAAFHGLKYSLDATSGTVYGVTVGRRWQAYQNATGGVGITTELLNKGMFEIERRCGQTPNMIVTSSVQFEQIVNQLEDQKRYTLTPKSKDYTGNMSFSGVEFMSSKGPIGIFWDRFCDADRLYLLNDKYIDLYQAPSALKWFDEDGTVFLRVDGEDAYQARYGGYGDFFIPPFAHGVLTGLATS